MKYDYYCQNAKYTTLNKAGICQEIDFKRSDYLVFNEAHESQFNVCMCLCVCACVRANQYQNIHCHNLIYTYFITFTNNAH